MFLPRFSFCFRPSGILAQIALSCVSADHPRRWSNSSRQYRRKIPCGLCEEQKLALRVSHPEMRNPVGVARTQMATGQAPGIWRPANEGGQAGILLTATLTAKQLD